MAWGPDPAIKSDLKRKQSRSFSSALFRAHSRSRSRSCSCSCSPSLPLARHLLLSLRALLEYVETLSGGVTGRAATSGDCDGQLGMGGLGCSPEAVFISRAVGSTSTKVPRVLAWLEEDSSSKGHIDIQGCSGTIPHYTRHGEPWWMWNLARGRVEWQRDMESGGIERSLRLQAEKRLRFLRQQAKKQL